MTSCKGIITEDRTHIKKTLLVDRLMSGSRIREIAVEAFFGNLVEKSNYILLNSSKSEMILTEFDMAYKFGFEHRKNSAANKLFLLELEPSQVIISDTDSDHESTDVESLQ